MSKTKPTANTSTNVNAPTDAPVSIAPTGDEGAKALVWNKDLDRALVAAVVSGGTAEQITAHLAGDELFAGLPVTEAKVRARRAHLARLLDAEEVELPTFHRAKRYAPQAGFFKDLLGS